MADSKPRIAGSFSLNMKHVQMRSANLETLLSGAPFGARGPYLSVLYTLRREVSIFECGPGTP